MSLPVIIRPEAGRDLDDARDWYDQQRPGLGDVFADRVDVAIRALGRFPELYGLIWEDVRAATIRKHPHVIYYTVLADRVDVFAILHGGRDHSAWRDRR